MTEAIQGRRERKKAATHDAIATAARELFLERGFERVGVKDVADAADVSTTTLFTHFPTKESLLFDEDEDREAGLVAAVRERPAGASIPRALRDYLAVNWAAHLGHPGMPAFVELIHSTPALEEYGRRMWTRHEHSLARAIAQEVGADPDDLASAALARFALDAPAIVRGRPDVAAALAEVFDVIEHGWATRG
jgi:AcrR family transcriptional regulator